MFFVLYLNVLLFSAEWRVTLMDKQEGLGSSAKVAIRGNTNSC